LTIRRAIYQDKIMSDIDYHEYLFKIADHSELYARSWRPINSLGVIVIVHGYAEHSGRYKWAALQLADRGFTVYTFDLRGHGKSSGLRNMVQSFDDYLTDLAAFLEKVKSEEPNKPLFLFGHSLGGAIAALFTIRYKPLLSGLITSSAFLANRDIPGVLVQLVILLGRLMPRLPTMFLDAETLSRDPEVVDIYKADLLIGSGTIGARTIAKVLKAIVEISNRMNEIELPLLVLHGTEDRSADIKGSRRIYAGVSSKDKSIKLYDGLYHELLNEPEKMEVLSDIDVWLRKHLPTD
jgi:acylglycerol lipase